MQFLLPLTLSVDALGTIGHVVDGVKRLDDNNVNSQVQFHLVFEFSGLGGFYAFASHENPGTGFCFSVQRILILVYRSGWELNGELWRCLILYDPEFAIFAI
jgi:hypothetical protein